MKQSPSSDFIAGLLSLPGREASSQELAAALGEIDIERILRQLLSTGERHNDLLTDMAGDSYSHGNGFAKVSLPTFGSPMRARIHGWIGPTIRLPDAHNHRWPFASRVLRGSLRVEYFEIQDGGLPLLHYRHTQINPDSGYRFVDMGKATLIKVAERIVPRGAIYEEQQGLIHRVLNLGDQPTATFVIEGPTVTGVTDVFSTSVKDADTDLDPPRFAANQVLGILRRLAH